MVLIILFHFLLILTATAAVGLGPSSPDEDVCKPARCKHGPHIRYPFRLVGRQPVNCGYSPEFDLSCNNNNKTVLELPKSVKLLVKHIDYVHQKIQVFDENRCVQKQLRNLKLSASHFNLSSTDAYNSVYGTQGRNFTLFNCSEENQSDYRYDSIPCLSTDVPAGYFVKYSYSEYASSDLLHCTKIIDIVEVPQEMMSDQSNNFYFTWSEPACGDFCEAKTQECRANISTTTSGNDYYCIPGKHIGMF